MAWPQLPHIRIECGRGEQATMFFLDPSGNALEFKAFHDLKQLFAQQNVSSHDIPGWTRLNRVKALVLCP